MSLVFTKIHAVLRHGIINKVVPVRYFTRGTVFRSEEVQDEPVGNPNKIKIDPAKDRRNKIPVETSIRYLKSDAFKETYGDSLVWELYRRNHKGAFPPRKTRKTCIRKGIISAGNPCPICRDEYLVPDYRNIQLLNQFISKFNGEILSYRKTGVCQRQHQNLVVSIMRAKNYGFITYDPPMRRYNYSDWYSPK